jgi:DNA-binding MarR family transcriptional regulator
MTSSAGFGTLLRNLIDRLDSDVDQRYREDGLDYRPRFTPVARALSIFGPKSIATIAREAGMRHSAISQTVAQMRRQGLITLVAGRDGRERLVTPTPLLVSMMPQLVRHWAATNAAAAELDAELPQSLVAAVRAALEALEQRSFADRTRETFSRQEAHDAVDRRA